MIETQTVESDRGKRCDSCGKELYRIGRTWWIASHGEYCSQECGEAGAMELEQAILKCREQADLQLGRYDNVKAADEYEMEAQTLEALR